MILGIDHIAVAVDDLESSIELYQRAFDAKVTHREEIAEFGVEIATITFGRTSVELVQGRRADSPIRKFIAKRGQGLHHIAFAVTDIVEALERLKERGFEVIDETPRRGKDGSLVAFLHPKSTEGVLYELVQLEK